MKSLAVVLLCLLAVLPPPSAAAYELEVGAGVWGTKTAYRKYDIDWMPAPVVDFENDYLYFRDLGLGAKLVTWEDGEGKPFMVLSAFGAYDLFCFDRQETSDWRLRQLDSRRESVFIGAKLDSATPAGLFEASVAGDVSGHSDGWLGRLAYHLPIDLGCVEAVPRLGLGWNDGRYNRYYYGVSPAESLRSGLPAYSPSGAVSPFAGLAAYLPLGEHWELAAEFEIGLVPETLRDSPMTDRVSVYALGMKLSYIF